MSLWRIASTLPYTFLQGGPPPRGSCREEENNTSEEEEENSTASASVDTSGHGGSSDVEAGSCSSVDPNAQERAAQAAECDVVGVHDSTEVVQSEVGCLKAWGSLQCGLLLHKKCVEEMIEKHIQTIIILPKKKRCLFPECGKDEFMVALRVPKDDTKKKEKKDKKDKVKELAYPKFSFHPARAHGDLPKSAVVAIEGIHLGWRLTGPDATPTGCEQAEDGGLPEPLELLSVDDVRKSAGDRDFPDFVLASIKQHRSARWKIGVFLLRTAFELIAVYFFMAFLGSVPNTYTGNPYKPWDTVSDDAFRFPGLFVFPKVWRGPGMIPIWWRYLYTFFGFFFLKLTIAILWTRLRSRGPLSRALRHFLAAMYPLAVCVPFLLYLLYYEAAVLNCKSCSLWKCGVYATSSPHLKLHQEAFRADGGCNITHVTQLSSLRQHVTEERRQVGTQHQNCEFQGNVVLGWLGISLDTTRFERTCNPLLDTARARDEVMLREMDEICGPDSTRKLKLRSYNVTEEDRASLPWSIFARSLPIDNSRLCSQNDPDFEGPYIYYEPEAGPAPGHGDHDVKRGGICVCRSAMGSRDCFHRVEGTAERCTRFTNAPTEHGSSLQFGAALGENWFSNFMGVIIPLFALYTLKAWCDIPLAGEDKFDMRMQSRMRMDILDSYLFYFFSVCWGRTDESLPLVPIAFPNTTWHDLELYIWVFAWVSAFVWWPLGIFVRQFDEDPDKTPKTWKKVRNILSAVETDARACRPESRVHDLYQSAVRKQSVLYEEELQNLLWPRTIVDILDDNIDIAEARERHWRRCIIVFSSPMVKDLQPTDFEREDGTFTLYVAGAWPWSAAPPSDVWKAASWEEYVANANDGATEESLARNLRKVTLKYNEVCVRLRPGSPYFIFDCRYLGWCYVCGCQPKAEYMPLQEEDHRLSEKHRTPGYSLIYYNRFHFDFFERNLEFFSAVRSLCVDALFFAARFARGLWLDGFSSPVVQLLLLKNLLFMVFGLAYVATCANSRHTCGPLRASPLELIAKCVERTQITRAIKLRMLVTLKMVVECLSCGFRTVGEHRQAYLVQRLHSLLYKRMKLGEQRAEDDQDKLDHEIRILAGKIDEYKTLIKLLETKHIVRIKAQMGAKDMIG